MAHKVLRAALVAVMMLALFVAPIMAGGWAVSTLDSLPQEGMQAGQTYQIGFTMRQHGVSLFNQANPEVRIKAGSGAEQYSFRATRNGDGHYVANVKFPREGTWSWVIDQVPFATQELGTIDIRPVVVEPAPQPAAVAQPAAAAPSASMEQSLLGYALAGLLALAVLVWRRPFLARGARGVR